MIVSTISMMQAERRASGTNNEAVGPHSLHVTTATVSAAVFII